MLDVHDAVQNPWDDEILQHPSLDTSAMESTLEMLRVASDVQTHLENYLAQFDLSCRRFLTLVLLSRHPEGTKSSFLADRTGVSAPTMTVVVDKLVRDQLATKVPSPTDRRATVVCITDRGHMRLSQILPEYTQRLGALMENVTETKRKKFRKTLELITKGLHTLEQPND